MNRPRLVTAFILAVVLISIAEPSWAQITNLQLSLKREYGGRTLFRECRLDVTILEGKGRSGLVCSRTPGPETPGSVSGIGTHWRRGQHNSEALRSQRFLRWRACRNRFDGRRWTVRNPDGDRTRTEDGGTRFVRQRHIHDRQPPRIDQAALFASQRTTESGDAGVGGSPLTILDDDLIRLFNDDSAKHIVYTVRLTDGTTEEVSVLQVVGRSRVHCHRRKTRP